MSATSAQTTLQMKSARSPVVNPSNVDKYAHLAGIDEIAENDLNLNIPRYVDTFE